MQLISLVQIERAACVTFPLCAVKVTHGSGAGLKHCVSGAVLWSRSSKAFGNAGRSPSGKREYGVETRASVAILCDPVFAEVCTGKGINRPDNRRFFQVVKRVAVNDSIGQRGDYASTAGVERKNRFCVKKFFW
ncbi:hypothetical protein [Citrobacter youngae]|uniref:hypothetical protein n=1 Tax=Citrobacter youngae TaxID=133448 RepID=UPI002A3663B5|nr:hypothetical protein [Citrobacter youngae]